MLLESIYLQSSLSKNNEFFTLDKDEWKTTDIIWIVILIVWILLFIFTIVWAIYKAQKNKKRADVGLIVSLICFPFYWIYYFCGVLGK